MTEKKYTWFVEPIDAHTNRVIFGYLNEANKTPSACRELKVKGGYLKNLLIVDRETIYALSKSKAEFSLSYNVYYQIGNGAITPSDFLDNDGRYSNKEETNEKLAKMAREIKNKAIPKDIRGKMINLLKKTRIERGHIFKNIGD